MVVLAQKSGNASILHVQVILVWHLPLAIVRAEKSRELPIALNLARLGPDGSVGTTDARAQTCLEGDMMFASTLLHLLRLCRKGDLVPRASLAFMPPSAPLSLHTSEKFTDDK